MGWLWWVSDDYVVTYGAKLCVPCQNSMDMEMIIMYIMQWYQFMFLERIDEGEDAGVSGGWKMKL